MFGALLYLGTATIIPTIDYSNQTTINYPIKNLEKVSGKMYEEYPYEYNINDDVIMTKTERNLENMQLNQKYYKEYRSVIINKKNISLIKPIVFLVNHTVDGVYFTNTDLTIYSGGENFEIAEQNMYEELVIQWEIYANEKDSNMTDKAIKIKNNLRSTINLDA